MTGWPLMGAVRPDWYVFLAAPQCEAAVQRTLGNRGIAAMVPHTEHIERVGKSRSRVRVAQPAFPGYVFAEVAGRQWGLIRLVTYLHPQPLAMDGAPYRLSADDVAYIRRLQDNPPAHPQAARKYMPGELVRILQGPFAEFRASVRADKGRKLHVSAQIFGRPTPVTVPREWVEAA